MAAPPPPRCITLFRGALQLHFFGRNRAAQRLYIMRRRKKEKSVFATAGDVLWSRNFVVQLWFIKRAIEENPLPQKKGNANGESYCNYWASLVLLLIDND